MEQDRNSHSLKANGQLIGRRKILVLYIGSVDKWEKTKCVIHGYHLGTIEKEEGEHDLLPDGGFKDNNVGIMEEALSLSGNSLL